MALHGLLDLLEAELVVVDDVRIGHGYHDGMEKGGKNGLRCG